LSTNIRQHLAACPLFHEVDAAGLDRLEAMATLRHFAADEVIFREGDPTPGLFIVAEGQVRIFKLNPSGKTHVLHLADPGHTFAEVAVLGGFDCPASAEAIRESTCVLLPNKALRQALRDSHPLCLQMLQGMAKWVRSLVGLLEGITLRDAAGRLAHFLLNHACDDDSQVTLQAMKRDLASHLNLTSETLSRTLRKLEDEGLIDRSNPHQIRLLDRRGLEHVAEGVELGG